MIDTEVRRMYDERGASLILAIAFMLLVGVISAAVISTTSSGIQDRVALDQARNGEYSADAAIETTIVAARALNGVCPSPAATPFSLNGIKIHVDCSTALVIEPNGTLHSLGDLLFVACIANGSGYGTPCTDSSGTDPPKISARIHFQITSGAVTTFVQTWSVTG